MVTFQPIRILYWLCSFYSDNEIIMMDGRPVICTLIGCVKSSCLFTSLSGFCGKYLKVRTAGIVCTSNTMTMVENIVWIPGILHSLKFWIILPVSLTPVGFLKINFMYFTRMYINLLSWPKLLIYLVLWLRA